MTNAPTDFDRQVFINCPFDASLEKAGFTTEEIDRLEPAEWIRRAVSWIASPVTDGLD